MYTINSEVYKHEVRILVCRHEGWWTYEFCFQKHVRQFHTETVQSSSKDNTASKKSTVVKSEFILGRFPFEGQPKQGGKAADAGQPAIPVK